MALTMPNKKIKIGYERWSHQQADKRAVAARKGLSQTNGVDFDLTFRVQ